MDERDGVKRTWDSNSSAWMKRVSGSDDILRHKVVLPEFLKLLGSIEGKRIIDIGCGDGSLAVQLRNLGAQVDAIDISPAMIELARSFKSAKGITYHVGDFSSNTILHDRYFDAATSFMALMNFSELDQTLSKAAASLKPGGKLVIAILHPCFSTQGSAWIRTKVSGKTGKFVSNYFAEQAYETEIRLDTDAKGELVDLRFPRTLSDYINSLVASGFQITKVCEPRPTQKLSDEVPSLKAHRMHACETLLLECKTPNDHYL